MADTLTTSFDTLFHHAFTRPIDWTTEWGLHTRGLHSEFHGRKYRRGKQRCRYCGAKLPAGGEVTAPPYRTNRDALVRNIFTQRPLMRYLQKRGTNG